jgi:thiol-disulfide isomerase/thioredoxin
MKTVKSILVSVVLVVLVSVSALAQSNAKVIAVINKADWCPTCQQNGERAMAAFMANNKDMSIQFVANDVTDDNTKKKSAVELKKLGLEKEVAENCKATGVAYFFNSETKALISQVSVAKTDQELASALTTAKKGLKQ